MEQLPLCSNLAVGGDRLFFAGQDTKELARRYGTPLYLMDEDRIRSNCRMYKKALRESFGGVKTDDYCRVLKADQSPIPGLYVAGVDNGSLYCSPYYENEGASLGIAYTSGIVAADCMVEYLNA